MSYEQQQHDQMAHMRRIVGEAMDRVEAHMYPQVIEDIIRNVAIYGACTVMWDGTTVRVEKP